MADSVSDDPLSAQQDQDPQHVLRQIQPVLPAFEHVCDGFVGNVVLKTCEQLALAMGHIIKRNLKKNPIWMMGALMAKGALKDLKKQADYSETGGAPLLGVAGVCMIGHGISNAKAVRNGIHAAGELVRQRVNETISEKVSKLALVENME